jgi:hypothetical protein
MMEGRLARPGRFVMAAALALVGVAATTPKPAEAQRGPGFDFTIPAGKTETIGPNCGISGDIVVNGKAVHDGDYLSALVTALHIRASVTPGKDTDSVSGRCYTGPNAGADMNGWVTDQIGRNDAKGKFSRTDRIDIASEQFNTQDKIKGTCTDDFEMAPGETRFLPAGTVVKGDFDFNGVKINDDASESGLIGVLNEGGTVHSPDGVNVQILKQCLENADALRGQVINRFTRELLETGCRPTRTRCEEVDVVYLPGGKQANGNLKIENAVAKVNRDSRPWEQRVRPNGYVGQRAA